MNKNDKYWKKLKDENYNDSFPKVERWVGSLNSEKNQTFKLTKIQSMKNFFAFNKFKLVYAFLLLAVVFAACNMPVTQNETVAYGLTWKVAKSSTESIAKINSLPWIDKSQLSVQEQSNEDKSILNYNLILNTHSEEELNTYMRQLNDIRDILTVNVFPINQETKRPLYAAALHSFFRLDIDATNRSDEDVKAEIQKQLKDAGVNIDVNFKRNASGERMLEIQPSASGLNGMEDAAKNKDFELSVKDGKNEQFIKTRHKTGELNLEGKSDEEIRRIVTEDMKKNGMDVKPEDLKIGRDEKGRVTIEFQNTETSKDRHTEKKIELNVK